MFSDVESRLRKKNRLLFTQASMSLQPLVKKMREQTHRTLVMWALDCGETVTTEIERDDPLEGRPRRCLQLCTEWARGNIKMATAKKAILAVHAAAREYHDPVMGDRLHAVGQAGSTVHVGTHAIGLPMYELSALVRIHGTEKYQRSVEEKIDYYMARLLHWEALTDSMVLPWAAFLQDG